MGLDSNHRHNKNCSGLKKMVAKCVGLLGQTFLN